MIIDFGTEPCPSVSEAMSSTEPKGAAVNDLEDHCPANAVNVWQTLEALVGSNLRKKYHYEGYRDVGNSILKIFTATRQRDSFSDKFAGDESASNFGGAADAGTGNVGARERHVDVAFKKTKRRHMTRTKAVDFDDGGPDMMEKLDLGFDSEMDCRLNYPRITAHLERLMGTNVVRLTDRQYMKDLRERIDEDYQAKLAKRIHDREVKEVERERKLILEGKTDDIPEELADDPIFKVQKQVATKISTRRAKLKTTREKNAERLLRQGMKWERERILYEEMERQKQEERTRVAREQRALQETYRMEDPVRGLDLLRIPNEEWRQCEEGLRDFLVRQRCMWKERSMKVPTRYTSDKKDIEEIIKARQEFRDTERSVRKRLGSTCPADTTPQSPTPSYLAKSAANRQLESGDGKTEGEPETDRIHHGSFPEADDSSFSSIESKKLTLEQTIELQTENIDRVKKSIEKDIERGYLAPKSDLNNYFYINPKIVKLRKAKTMAELFKIADEIITGQEYDEHLAGGEEEPYFDGEQVGSDLEGIEDED